MRNKIFSILLKVLSREANEAHRIVMWQLDNYNIKDGVQYYYVELKYRFVSHKVEILKELCKFLDPRRGKDE